MRVIYLCTMATLIAALLSAAGCSTDSGLCSQCGAPLTELRAELKNPAVRPDKTIELDFVLVNGTDSAAALTCTLCERAAENCKLFSLSRVYTGGAERSSGVTTRATMMFVLLACWVLPCSCRGPGPDGPAKVTESEARRLATEHVNAKFAGHVWTTILGDRKFQRVSAESWHSIEIKDGRLVLKYGYGNRGQDFTLSMNLDGTDIKVEHCGYALR